MKQFYLAIFIILFVLQFNNRYSFTIGNGNSMDPTIKDGTLMLIDLKAEPKDGDILILNTTDMKNWENSATQIVKRYYEEYSTDGYYVLGDNANVSYDSRYCGEIEKERLIGVVVYQFR